MPPALLTPHLLNTLRTHPFLPARTWYFIAGVTLSALNRPDEIPRVLRFALESCTNENDTALREKKEQALLTRFREGLVKSAPIVGLPRTINSLQALKSATPPHLLDHPPEFKSAGDVHSSETVDRKENERYIDIYHTPAAQIMDRGRSLFDSIYGKVTQRVMGNLASSAEDLGLVARLQYGYILSGRPSILNPVETSCVLLAALIPQNVNPQLIGHLRGMVNNGADVEEVRAVRDVVVKICEAANVKDLNEVAKL